LIRVAIGPKSVVANWKVSVSRICIPFSGRTFGQTSLIVSAVTAVWVSPTTTIF
jgi:hypothetical protein